MVTEHSQAVILVFTVSECVAHCIFFANVELPEKLDTIGYEEEEAEGEHYIAWQGDYLRICSPEDHEGRQEEENELGHEEIEGLVSFSLQHINCDIHRRQGLVPHECSLSSEDEGERSCSDAQKAETKRDWCEREERHLQLPSSSSCRTSHSAEAEP